MSIKCCYKCEDRHIGCHSTCERYIKEKEKVVKANMEAFKLRENVVLYTKTRAKKGK